MQTQAPPSTYRPNPLDEHAAFFASGTLSSLTCSPNTTATLLGLFNWVSDFLLPKDEEAVKKLTVTPGTKSELPRPVQDLIKMIFDVESMKKAMVEYEVIALPFYREHLLGLMIWVLSC